MALPVWGRGRMVPDADATGVTRRDMLAFAAALGMVAGAPRFAGAASPQGQLTWGVHTTLAPTWFDPAETPGIITPFMVMYAMHDAVVKPMPDGPLTPCLAESFTASEDALTYDFVLRDGALFHNGDPVTAEDVKFSFERYRGTSAQLLKDQVAAIETPDARHVRFKLKEPWPDFMTYYVSATGAGWVVPKKYVEQVGDDGFKRAPIGAGPYKFVSFSPGVELVFEAFEQYWRKPPSVRRIVFRVIPEATTRLASLKGGEIDLVYAMNGELAVDVQATEGLTLAPVYPPGPFWLYFPEQWDPKSVWHDVRVRRAANLAINRESINNALTLGYSKLTNSIIPDMFEYAWQAPQPVFDPDQAKKLLAEAGHPNGIDAGNYYCDSSWANLGEAVLDNLRSAGIRCRLRPLERAAFFGSYGDKKLNNIIQGASGAFGNAATRLAAFVVKDGAYVYGSYPEIDELFKQQAEELDPTKREAILHKMQQMVHEKAIYAPIWQLAFLNAYGPRVDQSGFGLIPGFAYTGPYEDMTIKSA
jgi:peptide/nickel transport system substrate-binding protein